MSFTITTRQRRAGKGFYTCYQCVTPEGWRYSSSNKRQMLDNLRRMFSIRSVEFVPVTNEHEGWRVLMVAGLREMVRETA